MFENKVVAITGAGSGIGRALAVNLAKRGAALALSDIDEAGLLLTQSMLPAECRSKTYLVNVSVEEEVYQFADAVKADFGAAHYIINNAGTAIFGTVENISLKELRRILDINMWGVIYGSKAFLPKMLEQKEGCIVNVSSVFGLVAPPCQVAYNVSKFAVRGFTETLWSELEGTGVRAVIVHPGGIATGIKGHSPICQNGGEFEKKVSKACGDTLVTPPEECAEEIVQGLISNDVRLLVGSGAKQLQQLACSHPDDYTQILTKNLGL